MTNWKTYKLGDLITFQRGHDLPQTEFIDGKYPIVASNGIIGFHHEYTTNAPGITIGRSGNIGKPFYIEKDFWAHNTTLYIKEYKGVDTKFIYYLLRTLNLSDYNSGSAVPTLNRNYIHPIEVVIPEAIEEQRAIANILSSLDDKIELNRQQNETLEKIAQAIFKHWFVDFEFPNEEGKPYKSYGGEMQESELELIPKGWRVGKLGEEFKIVMGQSPPGDSYNEIGDGIIFYQGRTDFGYRYPTPRVFCTSPSRYADKFDTLVSVRAPVGDINMAIDRCCIGRGLSSLIHNNGLKSYTFYCIHNLKKEISSFESDGTVFGSISKPKFDNIIHIIPDLNIIKKFDDIINSIDVKFYNNSIQNITLTKLRDELLPKLMSGKIRVKERS